ncbi:ABC transporter substrate-binding protein [Ilumatobacter nonamiensis]|uniref:ABC transporter substrate-binding protein n=1 Tax=Ilumatobacter nonamiensis TaxID=467093 RepID=UPI00130EDC7E|nr:ABC transporter substrate-binding protein [Ilumatobacter nonamiensis]
MSLDPTKSTAGSDAIVLNLLYDRLIHISPDGEPIPGLAESWEIDPTGNTMTLHLRDDVTFHDGTPLDADAVKANLDRAMAEESTVNAELATFDSVEVIDPQTVQFTVPLASPALPLYLTGRSAMMMSPASFGAVDLDTKPAGSGMYTVTETDPGVSVEFVRNDDYWDPEAIGAAGVEVSYNTDGQTRLNSVKDGQTDWAFIDAAAADEAADAGLQLLDQTDIVFYRVALNLARAEFDNELVRQAISYAIDREAILDVVFDGEGIVLDQAFLPGRPGYNEDVAGTYTYDPDKARALLTEAGVDEGVAFELLTPNSTYYSKMSDAIAAQLAEVGITATLRPVPGGDVIRLYAIDKDTDALTVANRSGNLDPLITLRDLYSEDGRLNPSGMTVPGFNELYEEASTATDADAREAAIESLTALVVESAMDIPMFNATSFFAMAPGVAGAQGYLNGQPEFRGVGIVAG